jgi:iron(III) transport system ATP-binding protein
VQVRGITASTANRFAVTIAELEFLGSFCRATLRAASSEVTLTADFSINLMRDLDVGIGKTLEIALPADRLRVFAGEAAG